MSAHSGLRNDRIDRPHAMGLACLICLAAGRPPARSRARSPARPIARPARPAHRRTFRATASSSAGDMPPGAIANPPRARLAGLTGERPGRAAPHRTARLPVAPARALWRRWQYCAIGSAFLMEFSLRAFPTLRFDLATRRWGRLGSMQVDWMK